MPFKKGQSGNPAGKKPGTLSRNTLAAREAFQLAFDKIGGGVQLAKWAEENQTEFYKLYGRLIPIDVNNNHGLQDTFAEVLREVHSRGRPKPPA